MRPILAILCALSMAAPAWSQIPPAGPARDKLRDEVLKKWETAMAQVKSLEADVTRTNDDKIFAKDVYRGSIRYLKGDPATQTPRCASLKLTNVANPQVYEHFILSGATLYDVAPANKVIRVHDWTKLVGNAPDANDFLLGMTAAKATAQFKIELLPIDDRAQDAYYWMLRFEPKAARDKQNFAKARILLVKQTSLPSQVILQQASGATTTWDLSRVDPNARLGAGDFAQPTLPAGWTWNRP